MNYAPFRLFFCYYFPLFIIWEMKCIERPRFKTKGEGQVCVLLNTPYSSLYPKIRTERYRNSFLPSALRVLNTNALEQNLSWYSIHFECIPYLVRNYLLYCVFMFLNCEQQISYLNWINKYLSIYLSIDSIKSKY